MRSIREILRLSFDLKLSTNEISRITGISRGAIQNCIKAAKNRQIDWSTDGDDKALEEKLFGTKQAIAPKLLEPDWESVHNELKKPGVNRALLWTEYIANAPEGKYSYSQFNRRLKIWMKKQELSMRQEHKAGDKLFVDYAGQTVPVVVDRETGEVELAQVFVATLGASDYTYMEASSSQNLHDWCNAHVRAFNFFQGVPACLTPDNLKSGVTKAEPFDPQLNRTYQRLAQHYGCAIRAARSKHPKDKAKVEKGVQFAETWVLARLRNLTFFSLTQLNETIQELLVELNDRPFQKLTATRRSLYESIDRPALRPLPATPFEFEKWMIAIKIEKDYHVTVEGHHYSVPHQLRGERVDVRFTDHVVEVFRNNVRVTSHPRNYIDNGQSTLDEHRPRQHALYAGMSAEKFLKESEAIGPFTNQVVAETIRSHPYPQLAFDKCFGILYSLRNKHGEQRLEAAAEYAIRIGSPSYRVMKAALENADLPQQLTITTMDSHPNLRGPEEFAQQGEQYAD